MTKENGFLPLRRGLWEHIRDGRLSTTATLAFIYICSQADTRTGIWKGSGKSLAGELGMKERTARDVLEKMEHGGYIRRFTVPGRRHTCYPILVHKFPITQGEHTGEQLDALNSLDANTLRYLPVETRQQSGVHGGEHGGEHGAAQRRIENIEKRRKKTPAAKPAPPADPRHQPFVDFACKGFEAKHGQKPSWQGKDFKALSVMLASNKGLGIDELERRFGNYLASTEPFTQRQGDSLAHFCTHIDSFLAGPILAAPKKGAIDADQRTRENLRAAGLLPN